MVLALIASQPEAAQTTQLISTGLNVRTAVDMLTRLGAIIQVDGKTSLSDIGNQLAQSQGLIDSSGQLTPAGEQLLPQQQSDQNVGADQMNMQQPPPDQLDNFDMGVGGTPDQNMEPGQQLPEESFKLMTSVIFQAL